MILLVVDTQKGCFDERLYSFETVKENIKQLITIACSECAPRVEDLLLFL